MFEIGSSLRQARQHRRLELADVERATHIRVKYLSALEDDRFEVLPGPAYTRGFLRTYAEFLGLDGSLLVEEFNTHVAPPEDEQQPLQPPTLRRPRNPLARPAAAAALALVASTLVVWQLGFSSPQPASPSSVRVAPRVTMPAKTVPARATKPPAQKRAPSKPVLLVRAAAGPCWVAVRVGSSTGRVLHQGTLTTGAQLRFGLQERLWVRLGAPWNVRVTIRGKPVSGLPHAPVSLSAA